MGLMGKSRKDHYIPLPLENALLIFQRVKTEMSIKQIIGENKQKVHWENPFQKKHQNTKTNAIYYFLQWLIILQVTNFIKF